MRGALLLGRRVVACVLALGPQALAAAPSGEPRGLEPIGDKPLVPAPKTVEIIEVHEESACVQSGAEEGHGHIFAPLISKGQFQFALGGLYDAVDPQILYGITVRAPQLALDLRYGFSENFSLIGHLNTLFVQTELTVGVQYAYHAGPLSFAPSLSVGGMLGFLDSFGFDALYLTPLYRPGLTFAMQTESIAYALRGELIFGGPDYVKVGSTDGALSSTEPFTGWAVSASLEKDLTEGTSFYLGAAVLGTRGYYQVWLLFPDSPAIYVYPRVFAGYEF